MFTAAIFDLDGTMADTEIIQSKAFEAILAEHGVVAELTEHGTIQVPGRTSRQIWTELKQKHGIETDVEELTLRKRDAAMKVLQEGLEPMRGLLALLDNLKENGMRLAIATSSQRERAEFITRQIGVADHFEAAITAQEIPKVKPEPDVYIEAARVLGVAPENCVAFEDSDVGVRAAKTAGMKVIAVPNAYTKRMDFSQADLVVDSLEDISYQTLATL